MSTTDTRAEMIKQAQRDLRKGAKYAYDHECDDVDESPAPPAKDFAHAAARGIIVDMCDRCGIKRGFEDIDHELRVEIVEKMAEIIRQAATEAAKATGTAEGLPPVPKHPNPRAFTWMDDEIRTIQEYGQACAEAACRDKNGNHIDDLSAWLDEAKNEIEVQGVAFHATSLKLQAAEAELAARQPAPVDVKFNAALDIVEAVRRDADPAFAHLLQTFDAATRSQP